MSSRATRDWFFAAMERMLICLLMLLTPMVASESNASEHTPELHQLSKQLHAQLELSKEEIDWLSAHPVIKVGVDAGYAPYSYLDKDGAYIGVAPDYLELLSDVLGIKFEIEKGLSWSEIIAGAKSQTLDLVATAVITEERKEFLEFSQIYIPTPLVIMTRSDENDITSAEHLIGKRVSLVKGYSSTERVLKEHPNIINTMVDSPIDGLGLLSTGEVDAYVGVLGVNFHLTRQYGLTNLKIASRYDLKTNGQRFGVR